MKPADTIAKTQIPPHTFLHSHRVTLSFQFQSLVPVETKNYYFYNFVNRFQNLLSRAILFTAASHATFTTLFFHWDGATTKKTEKHDAALSSPRLGSLNSSPWRVNEYLGSRRWGFDDETSD
jgi:hypothetical protein